MRLQYYPTTVLVLVVGISVSGYTGIEYMSAIFWMVVGNVLLHCACSLINEYSDFATGADLVDYPEMRWKATGGSKALVNQLINPNHVLGVSFFFFFLSLCTWVYLAFQVDYILVPILLFSLGVTFLYAAAFSRGGFYYVREVFMALGAVPLIVLSVVKIASGEYTLPAVTAGVITGMQLLNYLLYHGLVDIKADSESGKLRLTRVLGVEKTLLFSKVLIVGTFVVLGVSLYTGVLPPGCAVTSILILLAAKVIHAEMKKDIVDHYTHVVLLYIGTSGLLSLGFWL